MIERPTAQWRGDEDIWPRPFVDAVDAVLARYEQDVRALRDPSDADVLAVVERAVRALNDVDEEHAAIETGEREELCEYLDEVLTGAGIDVAALAERNDLEPGDLAGEWRDW